MPVKKRVTRRKRVKVSGTPKSRVFNGKRYTLKMCSTKKTEAKKRAETHRKKSTKAAARVVSANGKYCIYTRG